MGWLEELIYRFEMLRWKNDKCVEALRNITAVLSFFLFIFILLLLLFFFF